VDVIIATPGRLMAHLDKGSLKLNNTAALILDEVDVLAGMASQFLLFGVFSATFIRTYIHEPTTAVCNLFPVAFLYLRCDAE
jgi:hypothetical protein